MRKTIVVIICLLLLIGNGSIYVSAYEDKSREYISNTDDDKEKQVDSESGAEYQDKETDKSHDGKDDLSKDNEDSTNQDSEIKELQEDKQEGSGTEENYYKTDDALDRNSLYATTNDIELTVNNGDYTISQFEKDNNLYLYLPNTIDLANLVISYTGDIISVTQGILDNENRLITIDCTKTNTFKIVKSDNNVQEVNVLKSNLPSVSIDLNNTTLNEIHKDKNIKYGGNSVYIADANEQDSSYNFSSVNDVEIKGRGNTTWGGHDKKPYQIKFKSKTSVLGMGEAKKWVLLANSFDASLLKNNIGFTLAEKLGLETSEFRYVDLWIDGEYLGNYMICEKVEIGKKRLNLTDPKGILVELDNAYYADEDVYGSTNSGKYFTLKESVADDVDSSNSIAKGAFNDFIKCINDFENKLFNKKLKWSDLEKYIDVDDFVNYYILNEYISDVDGLYSSVYFYKDGDNDKIHIGPVWDFDSAFGGRTAGLATDGLGTLQVGYAASLNYYQYLFSYSEFTEKVTNRWSSISTEFKTINEYIDAQYAFLSNSADMNYSRWNQLGKVVYPIFNRFSKSYRGACDELINWNQKRYTFLNSFLQSTKISYTTHIQDIGWQGAKTSALVAGSTGKSLRLEAVKINIINNTSGGGIEYSTHIQDIGWQDWKKDGNISGTSGQSKRLEAIKIRLTGNIANDYDIYYRVHAQDFGWLDWAKNGESAGTAGYSYRLESLQIILVEKDGVAPGSTKRPYVQRYIGYATHVQDIGWQGTKYDGSVSGTSGQSKRLEGITIALQNQLYSGNIEYKTHIQDVGWQNWRSNGSVSGTTGESKRLEAIQIKLTGEMENKYDIYYRVHAQDYGWLGWAKNGSSAGTEGLSKRLEAIEVVLVGKGDNPPRNTINSFIKN